MARQLHLNPLQWGLVFSEAWTNDEFRRKLEQDPTTTIKAYAKDQLGIDLENAFQMPPPPPDLGMEALRSSGAWRGQYGTPATATGSGTAAGVSGDQYGTPATATGSGTAAGSCNS